MLVVFVEPIAGVDDLRYARNSAYPPLVYGSCRHRPLLIGVQLLSYDFGADSWQDVTPAAYRPMMQVMGVYHPDLDAVFFKGVWDTTEWRACFRWHRIDFGG